MSGEDCAPRPGSGCGAGTGAGRVLPVAAPAALDRDRVWHPHVRAAKKYAGSRAGDVSFAVRTSGRLAGFRTDHATSSASVVKAMLMVAYLNQEGVRGRELDDEDRALLDPMIRRSSNKAANQVYGIVGSDGLYRLARRVGMRNFTHDVRAGVAPRSPPPTRPGSSCG